MKFLSTKAHTVIGLVVGVLLILAPGLLGFSDNAAASAVAMWVGIFVIVSELITTSPYSPLKLVPMKAHIMLDILTGLFLMFSPWLFNFMDGAANHWMPHLVVGFLIVGYALVTNTADERAMINQQ